MLSLQFCLELSSPFPALLLRHASTFCTTCKEKKEGQKTLKYYLAVKRKMKAISRRAARPRLILHVSEGCRPAEDPTEACQCTNMHSAVHVSRVPQLGPIHYGLLNRAPCCECIQIKPPIPWTSAFTSLHTAKPLHPLGCFVCLQIFTAAGVQPVFLLRNTWKRNAFLI